MAGHHRQVTNYIPHLVVDYLMDESSADPTEAGALPALQQVGATACLVVELPGLGDLSAQEPVAGRCCGLWPFEEVYEAVCNCVDAEGGDLLEQHGDTFVVVWPPCGEAAELLRLQGRQAHTPRRAAAAGAWPLAVARSPASYHSPRGAPLSGGSPAWPGAAMAHAASPYAASPYAASPYAGPPPPHPAARSSPAPPAACTRRCKRSGLGCSGCVTRPKRSPRSWA